MHTIHGSSTNRTDSWRLSVDFRVQPCHAPPTLVSQNKGRQSGRRVLSYLASTPLPPSRGRWSRLRHSRSDFPRSMDEAHLKAHGSSHHWPCDGSSFESEAKTAWNLHEAKKRWVLLTDAHGGVPGRQLVVRSVLRLSLLLHSENGCAHDASSCCFLPASAINFGTHPLAHSC